MKSVDLMQQGLKRQSGGMLFLFFNKVFCDKVVHKKNTKREQGKAI